MKRCCIFPAASLSGIKSYWDRLLSSQGGVRQYSTRLKALQALRREMEDEFAKRLAAIDAQIEGEKAQ